MASLKRLLARLIVGGSLNTADDGTSALQVAGKSAFSDALTVANVPNQITLVRAAGQQFATFEDNDAQGALRITSYSVPGNAKSIGYDSRTDAAGSAVTAGALGHVFLLNGVSQFIINSSGASLSGNLSVSGTGTFGNTVSVAGDVRATTFRVPSSSPAAPASGYSLGYGHAIAGRTMAAALPTVGARIIPQAAQWDRKVGSWISGNVDSSGVFSGNFPSQTRVGTATPRTVTPGAMVGMSTRLGYASAATAGSLSGTYAATAQNSLGTGVYGGFQFTWRLNFSDPAYVAGARAFVGMSSNVAGPTNVEPSTLTNSIGLAQLSTDSSQLYIVYGGSAAQTVIPLGTGFPPMANTGITGGPIYDFTLYSPSTVNGVVYYRLERRDTGTFVEGSIGPGTAGTTLPANTTLLAPRAWRCNNATALAVGLDIHSMYCETEF